MKLFRKPGWRGYRPNVAIILINEKGEVFMGERFDTEGAWQTVQGGIEKGQTMSGAIEAEMYEEVGLAAEDYTHLMCMVGTVDYSYPEDSTTYLFRKGWAGQKQYFHLVRIKPGAIIDLTIHHQEFRSYKWSTAEDLLESIVAFKRPGIEAALRAFNLLK